MRLITGFWNDVNGNVTLMLGLAIVPLLLASSAAIDISRANYARTVLQGAVDSAALAGAMSSDKSDAKLMQVVEQYLEVNHASDVLEYITKTEQHVDKKAGTFNVSIEGSFKTTFMAIAGIGKMDVSASSQVSMGMQALEIALVLDNTGSMAGTKIASLKASAKSLVDIIEKESSSYADAKIAVVPFAEYVNVGAGSGSASWLDTSALLGATWKGCVGSRPNPLDLSPGQSGGKYPAIASVPCNAAVLPLTTNYDDVRSRINVMTATGSTYIPTGLLWGWNVLDNQAPFTEGLSKVKLKELRGRKAIVLMTDGENTISPTYPAHDGRDKATSNNNLVSICNNVKNDDITVYTVSFMVPTRPIKDILQNCATSTENYFDAANPAELAKAFTQIAHDLAAVRIAQ